MGEVRAFVCGWASGCAFALGAAVMVLESRPWLGLGLILVGAAVGLVWVAEL